MTVPAQPEGTRPPGGGQSPRVALLQRGPGSLSQPPGCCSEGERHKEQHRNREHRGSTRVTVRVTVRCSTQRQAAASAALSCPASHRHPKAGSRTRGIPQPHSGHLHSPRDSRMGGRRASLRWGVLTVLPTPAGAEHTVTARTPLEGRAAQGHSLGAIQLMKSTLCPCGQSKPPHPNRAAHRGVRSPRC